MGRQLCYSTFILAKYQSHCRSFELSPVTPLASSELSRLHGKNLFLTRYHTHNMNKLKVILLCYLYDFDKSIDATIRIWCRKQWSNRKLERSNFPKQVTGNAMKNITETYRRWTGNQGESLEKWSVAVSLKHTIYFAIGSHEIPAILLVSCQTFSTLLSAYPDPVSKCCIALKRSSLINISRSPKSPKEEGNGRKRLQSSSCQPFI